MDRKIFKYSDMKFILTLLLITIISYFIWRIINNNSNETEAVIMKNGYIISTVDLNKNKTFSIPENKEIILEVSDGAIRFLSSDCPDLICVNTGYIKHVGQIAACLPNNILIKVENKDSKNTSDIDTIVQ